MNFMGGEIGQLREWDEKRAQDWDLQKYPVHDSFFHYIQDLNRLYLSQPALFEGDYTENGFSWIDCHQEETCIYALSRRSKDTELIAVFNFSGMEQSYSLPAPYSKKTYDLLLHTDEEKYGGSTKPTSIQSSSLRLPPFSGVLLRK